MTLAKYVAQLLQVIVQYGLDRYEDGARIKLEIERGIMSEQRAKGYLTQVSDFIRHLDDFPNHLHRPPTREQLYAAGKPDVELGTLVEGDESIRFGLRLIDRPRHVLIAGATGSGKTTALRNIIINVDNIGRQKGGKEG